MPSYEDKKLLRDCAATRIPSGEAFTLAKDTEVTITQSLGGTFTVITPYGMARIEAKDADALGIEIPKEDAPKVKPGAESRSLEDQVWDQLKTVYDPEIPVNIVDLGLVYEMSLQDGEDSGKRVNVKMTLTAPGCGMGPTIQADAKSRIESLVGIQEANVDLVWEPAWHQGMISEVGKMKLGLM
jgi:probable FeS assembly SUF system protein SufT